MWRSEGSFKGCQSQLMVFLSWGLGKSLQLALVISAPAAVEPSLWDLMLQPSILTHLLRVPAHRLKESHQLVVQTQSKSQAEAFEVICCWKAEVAEVNGEGAQSHLIPPWGKVITFSPSTIPLQTSKCCSWMFVASTEIPFLTPACLKNHKWGWLKGFSGSPEGHKAIFPVLEIFLPFPKTDF